MTAARTDLEALAERMRLPTGGIAIILRADEPARLLVRASGGLTMDHLPLEETFDGRCGR